LSCTKDQFMKKLIFILSGLLFLFSCKGDQKPRANNAGMTATQTLNTNLNRFQKEIDRFAQADQSKMPEDGSILFIGSSSIRMWDSLEVDMAPMKAINRGFGGSTLPEVIHYADQIIFPYAPTTIVLYCGENDISEGASPLKVFRSFKKLVKLVRAKLPETEIYFLPMKPSIARWNLWPDYQKGNQLIANFIASQESLTYLDITPPMLTEAGTIDSTIFIEDGLHMNRKGYKAWRDIVQVALKELN